MLVQAIHARRASAEQRLQRQRGLDPLRDLRHPVGRKRYIGGRDRGQERRCNCPAQRPQAQPLVRVVDQVHGFSPRSRRSSRISWWSDSCCTSSFVTRWDSAGTSANCACSAISWRFVFSDDTCSRVTESRSEEHTSELQSLMRISYAVLCLKNK